MTEYEAIALALRYPAPGSLGLLEKAVAGLPEGAVRRHMERFLSEIPTLPLSAWEELHTRTLDLAPIFVPYLGYVVWGDNYQRGEFMAELKVAEDIAGIDREGELPDHLAPVLRYLAAARDPLPAVLEVFPPAAARMRKVLEEAESDNPYRHVLRAVEEVADRLEAPVGGAG